MSSLLKPFTPPALLKKGMRSAEPLEMIMLSKQVGEQSNGGLIEEANVQVFTVHTVRI